VTIRVTAPAAVTATIRITAPAVATSALALIVSVFPLWADDARAVEFDTHGFVDFHYGVRLGEPYDFITSRTRARVESWICEGKTWAYLSVNAVEDGVVPGEKGIELREAFVDYVADRWDLRVGRQIIVWGKADGMAITDIICPRDYAEFFAAEYDDTRIPIDAAKWRYLGSSFDLEFIWLPRFIPAAFPSEGSPWFVEIEFPADVEVEYQAALEPELTLENGEFAVKASIYTSAVDLAISCFRAWDDIPTAYREVVSQGDSVRVSLRPEYERTTFYGAELSRPWGDVVLRAEAAYFTGLRFEPADELSEEMFEKDALKGMLGVDWSPGANLAISAQFVDDFILDCEEAILNDEHTTLVTTSVSKTLFRETLELFGMAYFGLSDNDQYVRMAADYELADAFHLLAGVDFLSGDGGRFGRYDDNDQIWLRAKYSF
jgi:hypothetical protein